MGKLKRRWIPLVAALGLFMRRRGARAAALGGRRRRRARSARMLHDITAARSCMRCASRRVGGPSRAARMHAMRCIDRRSTRAMLAAAVVLAAQSTCECRLRSRARPRNAIVSA